MATAEIPLRGGTIRYHETGTGPPIVFIHGALVNSQLWRKIVPTLSQSYRCITPDWPLGAHDLPMGADADLTPLGLAALMAEFLAALDLHDVTIVGNDTGGGLAQLLVTRHPERIGALVLTPCDAFKNFPPRVFKPTQALGYVPGAFWLVAQTFRSRRLVGLLFRSLAKAPIPDDVLDAYRLPALTSAGVRRDFNRFFRSIRSRYTTEAAKVLPKFGKPALVVWADRDLLFPKRHGQKLADLLGARFEMVENSRTFISEDQPERLSQLIEDFLRQAAHSPATSTA